MNLEMYRKVYHKYFKLSRKIADDIVKDYYLAGDIAQEVFYEMYEKQEQLDAEQIKYWIVMNTNRRAIDTLRMPYHKYEKATGDFGKQQELSQCLKQEPETVMIQEEDIRIHKAVIEELREYNKMWYELIVRLYIESERYESVAKSYDMQVEVIRVYSYRAKKWMMKRLEELYGAEA